MTSAQAHLYRHRVLHLDFNLDNVVVDDGHTGDGCVVLIDFGAPVRCAEPEPTVDMADLEGRLRAPLLLTARQHRNLPGGALNRRSPEAQRTVDVVVRASDAARLSRAPPAIPDGQSFDWSKQPVFELGVNMYEIATGRYPFITPTPPVERYGDDALRPFESPGVSPAVVDLVRRMLRWDPAERPDLVEVINVLFSPDLM
jgi:serine/threonine protein kinase